MADWTFYIFIINQHNDYIPPEPPPSPGLCVGSVLPHCCWGYRGSMGSEPHGGSQGHQTEPGNAAWLQAHKGMGHITFEYV